MWVLSPALAEVLKETTLDVTVDNPEDVLEERDAIPLDAEVDNEVMPLVAVLSPEDVEDERETTELVTVERPELVDVLRLVILELAVLRPDEVDVDSDDTLLLAVLRPVDRDKTPVERLAIPVEEEVDRDVMELTAELIDVESEVPLIFTVVPAFVTPTPSEPVKVLNTRVVDVVAPVSRIATPPPSLRPPVIVPPKANVRT